MTWSSHAKTLRMRKVERWCCGVIWSIHHNFTFQQFPAKFDLFIQSIRPAQKMQSSPPIDKFIPDQQNENVIFKNCFLNDKKVFLNLPGFHRCNHTFLKKIIIGLIFFRHNDEQRLWENLLFPRKQIQMDRSTIPSKKKNIQTQINQITWKRHNRLSCKHICSWNVGNPKDNFKEICDF